MYNFYIVENHSTEETASYFSVHERTIRRKLVEYEMHKSVELQVECSKRKQIEKYGALFPQSDYYRNNVLENMLNKVDQTCMERYGVKRACQLPEVKDKSIQTCLGKYGVRTYTQTNEYHKKSKHIYKFDGVSFDSSTELCLWIYAKDHGESIERCPCKFEYFVNGEKHYYFPDFIYKNEIMEIKGNHLIDENNNLIDTYHNTPKELLLAKQECMKDNNVKIIKEKDLKFVVEYVKKSYGSSFIKNCKQMHKKRKK